MPRADIPSLADPPFALPLEIEIDLPVPPSVNRTRRIEWSSRAQHKAWQKSADAMLLGARCRAVNPLRCRSMPARFEATIILSEKHTRIDLDNSCKALLDWARRVELIVDDGPKYLRRLIVEWGPAPDGARLILRSIA